MEDEAEQVEQLRAENEQLRRMLKEATARKKKLEFSKIIFVGVSIGTVAITVFSCVVTWITMDTSILAYLIPAVFAEMASATAFYYTKAKVENKIKLKTMYGIKPESSDFSEEEEYSWR